MFLSWKHKIYNYQKTFSWGWNDKCVAMKNQFRGWLIANS